MFSDVLWTLRAIAGGGVADHVLDRVIQGTYSALGPTRVWLMPLHVDLLPRARTTGERPAGEDAREWMQGTGPVTPHAVISDGPGAGSLRQLFTRETALPLDLP